MEEGFSVKTVFVAFTI